jgi:hypothetical protein
MKKQYARNINESVDKEVNESAVAYHTDNAMETIQINLRKDVLERAVEYAKKRGRNLSDVISDYLVSLGHFNNESQVDIRSDKDFIDSLIIRDGQTVPNDVDTIDSLLKEKYL